jgi:hypothetical protein
MAADLPSAERTNRHWLNQFGAPKAKGGIRLSTRCSHSTKRRTERDGVSLALPPAPH